MKLLELYPPGHRVETGAHSFTADAIIAFARKHDPQPFHTDAEAARDFVFGALCASGWHTCAAWMRLFVDYWSTETVRLTAEGLTPPQLGPSPGFSRLQWLKPVFAGDTIRYGIEMVDSRPLASRPGWILNMGVADGINQKGETVLRFDSKILEFEEGVTP
ncbi:MaoC family dehydratase [Rhizobium halophytocola]|uniref:Acyl dehydratase n=1 Tax=Rhizobium halophytocola TaxID=735519 RepID=A0ABS4E3S4_9HYPH|nr:MaoC family dehydratase [Rhizobium halophytocola]MBP1852599.1 acyl dehydratase [Rhizobium halophytocola]